MLNTDIQGRETCYKMNLNLYKINDCEFIEISGGSHFDKKGP